MTSSWWPAGRLPDRTVMSVLYVQQRPHRAGAQTCLARLLRHPGLRAWRPTLVCSEAGWLAAESARAGVPVLVEPFPGSRSWSARLFRNRAFARRVAHQLSAQGLRPTLIHANDHLEGLLALTLARLCQARSAITLRSSGMTRADYFKYRCSEFDLLTVVGAGTRRRSLRGAG